MLKLKPLYLVLISASLLSLAWPPLPTAFLLFIGISPLFILHHNLKDKKRRHLKFFLYTYLCLFIFNVSTSWWVWNASPSGCLLMLFANSLILSLPFLMYSYTEKAAPKIAFFSFIVYYLAIEYFHFNWNAAWPWMTMGKGLSSMPSYIQWYEITGELGGSLLVLLCNVMVAQIIIRKTYKKAWKPIALILVFGFLSMFLAKLEKIPSKSNLKYECIVAQPNIDPFEEKFGDGYNYIEPEIQVEYAIDPCRPLITEKTDLLLLPETALVGFNNVDKLDQDGLFEPLRALTDKYNFCIIAGAETFKLYDSTEKRSNTARLDKFAGVWFDSYNSAVNIKDNSVKEIYHKAKLVAGVEKMPFSFLEKLSINLGGSSGSLGSSEKPINFTLKDGCKVAPLICYESIFGDYANEFVKDGAKFLTVITNDGWWGNTPGYQQHLLYGAVRCIETRREMVRSANTGVSAKIDRLGRITQKTKYNEKVAFKCTVKPNSRITFYVQYGNLIGKTASILALMILLSVFVRLFIKK